MRAVVAIVVIAAGCSGDGSPGPSRCPFGDSTQPAQLEVVHYDANFNAITTAVDDVLPMVIPPQGGWAVLLGARVTNIDGCHMDLKTSFRDVDSPAVLSLESRPVQPIEDLGDGWGMVPLGDVSNLQTCPLPDIPRNISDNSFLFTITVDDEDGQTASTELRLSTSCPVDDPSCKCECAKDHVVGDACPAS